MLQKFDTEWSVPSEIDPGRPLLRVLGWDQRVVLVTDLQTGEGAMFTPGGCASADLNGKHRIWVCPMFEPFLSWLYRQPLDDITRLPRVLTLSKEETAEHEGLQGYRRVGKCQFCGRENPLGSG